MQLVMYRIENVGKILISNECYGRSQAWGPSMMTSPVATPRILIYVEYLI